MPGSIRKSLLLVWLAGFLISCSDNSEDQLNRQSSIYVDPDWKKFRSIPFDQDVPDAPAGYAPGDGKFLFSDLKYESDESLSRRLLGALASRIVFIDRQQDRWDYYQDDDEPIHQIELFSKPESWGSAYGLCRIEKYEISFSDDGKISSVVVSPRYGVEGPIFQKEGYDWDLFRGSMCESVLPSHTPSYFPASESVLEAQDLSILLSIAIDQATRDGRLSYDLSCETYQGKACVDDSRRYLASLRLHDINSVNKLNCSRENSAEADCFTVTVGEHELGPYPKYITIKGTTYMNEWKVYSVSMVEGFTIS
ncbi:hypothetical protein ABC955_06520 [Citromicrobium bathyomarinum]